MKPMSSKAAMGIAILTGRHAAGEARPASGACQMNRFRYWFAADRSGTTACSVLPSVTAASVQSALEPRIDDDILLVTDGNNVYPPCAKALGIKHEAFNQSAGERVRGTIHIQTVNNRHSGIKGFLRHYRGVSSKYLGNYLRWYGRSDLLKSSPGSYLAVAIEGPPTRFAN